MYLWTKIKYLRFRLFRFVVSIFRVECFFLCFICSLIFAVQCSIWLMQIIFKSEFGSLSCSLFFGSFILVHVRHEWMRKSTLHFTSYSSIASKWIFILFFLDLLRLSNQNSLMHWCHWISSFFSSHFQFWNSVFCFWFVSQRREKRNTIDQRINWIRYANFFYFFFVCSRVFRSVQKILVSSSFLAVHFRLNFHNTRHQRYEMNSFVFSLQCCLLLFVVI